VPLNSALVGHSTDALIHLVDARWLMAYAAALGDFNPCYMDTQKHPVVAHPVFPVCPEWPVILNTRDLDARDSGSTTSLSAEESARGVHAAHDLHIYQPITAGDRIATTATMVGIKAIKPGAAYTMRLDTVNVDTNVLVARTYQLGIYRGVAITGGDRSIEQAPELPLFENLAEPETFQIDIAQGAAHTYTECARIWNPIHTDRAIALAAGLPDIILHGTATLALAISKIVNHFADGDPSCVQRLGGRFSAMISMPSTITLRAKCTDGIVSFEVINAQGKVAISGGFVEFNHLGKKA